MEYTVKEMNRLEKQMIKSFGKCLGVYHEVATEGNFHVDVELFKTNIDGKEFYTVVTMGMSKKEIEGAAEGYEHIELMFCMPPFWKYDKESWPVEVLKGIAKISLENDWFISPFVTIDLGEKCIAEKFSDVFIEYPRNFLPNEVMFKLGKKKIMVLQVYPIYKEEVQEILKENEKVMEKIVETVVFDENRDSVV